MSRTKHIVVTGGGQGIGFATAEALTKEGHDVSILDSNADALSKVREKLDCTTVHIDISNEDEVKSFFGSIDKLDALVNNAGIWIPQNLVDMSTEDQAQVVQVNLMGTVFCTKYALHKLDKTSDSVIVNLTSAAAKTNSPGLGLYAASKSAIETLTKQWALELAPIRVNAVGPGLIVTEGTAENYEGEARQIRGNAVPIKRLGDANDVSAVINFLISTEGRYVNGQIVYVDGGITAGSTRK